MIHPLFVTLLLQTTPVQPLPPANLQPPPGTEEAAVLAPVNRIFAAMRARDGAAILANVRPDGRLTGVSQLADPARPVTSRSWAEFAAQFKPGQGPVLDERLTGTPAIEIDGDIAMVWSNYVFLIDGKLSHCGVDHIDLVRENGRWAVLNLTWTRRTTDCEVP
jgi:hypothetical protein